MNLLETFFSRSVKGRAEATRLALVIGGIDFEDERINGEEWAVMKKKMPYKAVPIMTVDNRVYAQSIAMLRYAGKLTGLYPSDDLAALFVDEVGDTVTDLFACLYRCMGKDDQKMRESRHQFVHEDIPRYWGGLEARLNNAGAGPFILGEKISIADLGIFCMFTTVKSGIVDYVELDVLDEYVTLKGVYDSVTSIPEVKEWYQKHPIKNVTTD